MQGSLVAGARIRVRDSEWVVGHVDRSATSGAIVHATGLSAIVRDKEAIFVEALEKARGRGIEVVDPTDVLLVPDPSSGFADTLLGIASVRFDAPTWGMVQKVRHLITFPDQAIYEQHRLVLPQPVNEEADRALMRQLLFNRQDVELESLAEGKNKSPDFKIMKNGEIKAYCELKSPRDDWIFDVPKSSRIRLSLQRR
jgi:hypothetical protein